MRALLLVVFTLFVVGAQAQTIVINPPPGAGSAPAKAQRVTINITLVTGLAGGMSPSDLTAGLTTANQSLYTIVNHECDVLGPLLQGNCRLVQITTNGQINERPGFATQQGVPAISVSANATFELDPKQATLPITR